MDDILANVHVVQILTAIIIYAAVMQIVPGLVYFERRIAAWIQNRVGPNRVGPIGALQPLADVIKLAMLKVHDRLAETSHHPVSALGVGKELEADAHPELAGDWGGRGATVDGDQHDIAIRIRVDAEPAVVDPQEWRTLQVDDRIDARVGCHWTSQY